MKILSEKYLSTEKSPLNFGSHPEMDLDLDLGIFLNKMIMFSLVFFCLSVCLMIQKLLIKSL